MQKLLESGFRWHLIYAVKAEENEKRRWWYWCISKYPKEIPGFPPCKEVEICVDLMSGLRWRFTLCLLRLMVWETLYYMNKMILFPRLTLCYYASQNLYLIYIKKIIIILEASINIIIYSYQNMSQLFKLVKSKINIVENTHI